MMKVHFCSKNEHEDEQQLENDRPPSVFMLAGTNSGVGQTTVACGLMAACVRRGLVVQPFEVGPNFLDGVHDEAAICASSSSAYNFNGDESTGSSGDYIDSNVRKSINLDG